MTIFPGTVLRPAERFNAYLASEARWTGVPLPLTSLVDSLENLADSQVLMRDELEELRVTFEKVCT